MMTHEEGLVLNDGNCPDCHRRGFVIGPQGGPATNIECANVECRSRFNVVFFSGRVMACQRIPKEEDCGVEWPSKPKVLS